MVMTTSTFAGLTVLGCVSGSGGLGRWHRRILGRGCGSGEWIGSTDVMRDTRCIRRDERTDRRTEPVARDRTFVILLGLGFGKVP